MSWYMRPSADVSEETVADMRRMGRKHLEWLFRDDAGYVEYQCGCSMSSSTGDCLVHLCDFHSGFERAVQTLMRK